MTSRDVTRRGRQYFRRSHLGHRALTDCRVWTCYGSLGGTVQATRENGGIVLECRRAVCSLTETLPTDDS